MSLGKSCAYEAWRSLSSYYVCVCVCVIPISGRETFIAFYLFVWNAVEAGDGPAPATAGPRRRSVGLASPARLTGPAPTTGGPGRAILPGHTPPASPVLARAV